MAIFGPDRNQILRRDRKATAEQAAVEGSSTTDGLLALIDEVRGLRKDLEKAQTKADRYRSEVLELKRRH